MAVETQTYHSRSSGQGYAPIPWGIQLYLFREPVYILVFHGTSTTSCQLEITCYIIQCNLYTAVFFGSQ